MIESTIAAVSTVGGADDAHELASAIVERRLDACAQVSGIESFCTWNGKLQNEDEYRVLCNKTESGWKATLVAILRLHPRELPAIRAFTMERALGPHRDRIFDPVAPAGDEN
jgi:periplasmic divalent cation tolerance protein